MSIASPFQDNIRRLMDVAVALVALLFFFPLCLIVALSIKLQDGGKILYAQDRIGLGGRTFKCWKFRSMVVNAQERLDALLVSDTNARDEWLRDHKLKRDPRITKLGLFLRKSSMDELPQLYNVLMGEMSIVGPRPIVAAEVHRYRRQFRHYCSVKPGLTGLWQVSGRNNTSYRRRVAIDTLYVRNRSIGLDLKILAATIPAVLLRDGSY